MWVCLHFLPVGSNFTLHLVAHVSSMCATEQLVIEWIPVWRFVLSSKFFRNILVVVSDRWWMMTRLVWIPKLGVQLLCFHASPTASYGEYGSFFYWGVSFLHFSAGLGHHLLWTGTIPGKGKKGLLKPLTPWWSSRFLKIKLNPGFDLYNLRVSNWFQPYVYSI